MQKLFVEDFRIAQHCFGKPGTGGPVIAMERLLKRAPIKFVELRQIEAAGGLDFGLLYNFVKTLRKTRPELIHVRGLGNEGFHAALAAKIAGVPNILVSVHGTHRDLRFSGNRLRHAVVTRVLEPLTLHIATHIATVCHYASQRDFILQEKNKFIAVVPNGVIVPGLEKSNFSIRAEFSLPSELPLAVTVSRITEEKGYFVLANSLKVLDRQGAKFALIIIGGGDERGDIRARFDGLSNIIVRFAGHRSDVAKFLSDADFFVFPSLHENLSNALIEAMSYGLPVIATDTGGNTEVLQRGGGVLVPPAEVEPLANAIHRFIGDVELRKKLGVEARQVVIDRYSVEHMVDNWLKVYGKILGRQIGG